MDLESDLSIHIARLKNLRTAPGRIVRRLLEAEALLADPVRIAAVLENEDVRDVLYSARLATDCGWTPEFAAEIEARASAEVYAPPPASERVHVYCDGSCSHNGRAGARAGFGIHVCRGDKILHSHSAAVPAYEPQTNQRAELHALAYALQYIREAGLDDAVLVSDSKYAIDCLKTWAGAWEASGWVKADKSPIQHLDLIRPMYELYHTGSPVELRHVRGHSGAADADSRGNAAADRLAKAGAGASAGEK